MIVGGIFNGVKIFVKQLLLVGGPHKRGSCKIHSHHRMTKINDQRHMSTVQVAVEGNIGSGKTSMLQYFSKIPDTEVFEEPVKKWRNVRGHNLLALMYSNPERWSLTFQTYVQLTMLNLHKTESSRNVKFMERSIYSAKYCFVENLFKSGKMPEAEYIVLTEWFDWIIKNEDIQLDLIVYLRTSPEVVHKRIKKRCRSEEMGIPLEYLQTLHNLHEDWLIAQSQFSLPAPVLVLDGNQDILQMEDQFKEHSSEILCLKKSEPTLQGDPPLNGLIV